MIGEDTLREKHVPLLLGQADMEIPKDQKLVDYRASLAAVDQFNYSTDIDQQIYCKKTAINDDADYQVGLDFDGNPKHEVNTTPQELSSDFQVFMNLFKLYFGTACLCLPFIFSKTGWLGGVVLLSFMGVLNRYTMEMMIQVAERHPDVLTYSQLCNRVFGPGGKIFLDISLWCTQITCCISYMFFVAEQISHVMCEIDGYCGHQSFITVWLAPLVWLISMANTYTCLSYLSTAAIIVGMSSLLLTTAMSSHELGTHDDEIRIFNIGQMFGYASTVFFIFEGNAVVLNVRAEAINKQNFSNLLMWSQVVAVVVYSSFAVFNYIAYGNNMEVTIFLNLTPMSGTVIFVMGCFAFNIIITYPVQILAAFHVVELLPCFSPQTNTRCMIIAKRVAVRTSVVILVTITACLIPDLTFTANIGGAIFAYTVGIFIPVFLYNWEFHSEIQTWKRSLNYSLIVFGVVSGTISIYNTIANLGNDGGEAMPH